MTTARAPHRRPLIVAHRGGSPTDVENSLPAFEHALVIGVDLIECDLRMSADGTIVLSHDERVDGTKVSTLPVTELRRRMPTLVTLDDLLMLTSGTGTTSRLVLDLKERGIELALIPILEKRPDIERSVLVTTVHTASLRRLSERFPNLRLGLSRGHLIASLPATGLKRLAATVMGPLYPLWMLAQIRWSRAGTVALQHRLLGRRAVNRFRRMGCRVYAWTVDDCPEAERLAESGVDYVATNEPWEILGCLGRWPGDEPEPVSAGPVGS